MEGLALTLYDRKGQPWAPYLSGAPASIKEEGRPTVVYILSDFDPAGFRIAEKVEAGLREHIPEDQELTCLRIAVSYEQVMEHNLVTREVKKTDSGADEFIALYGDNSCELEAMPANMLRQLLRDCLETHMDQRKLRALKLAEAEEREGLKELEKFFTGAA